ncbi:hypothetical protein ACB092_10G033400 [Castanea dentata]
MTQLKTQIVSRTCIKRSSPTPHNLKTFELSLLEQLSLPIHANTTFFFPANAITTDPNLEFSRKSQLLQQSIADTLTRFYPLAGRLLDASAIDCNDDGGFFIEARCDSPLSDFLSKPNFETLDQFLPTTDPETLELSKGSMWLIKFTKFSCCGTTVSVSLSHKIIDIASLLTLLKSWTEICRGLSEPILPNLTGFSLLPPKDISGMSASLKISGDKFKIGRFVIRASKIAELKEKVISVIAREQYYPSRVELVLAKLWKCAAAPTVLFQGMNLRGRMDPPLPDIVFGNFVWPFAVIVEEESDLEVHKLVQSMREAKNDFLNKKANKFRGEGGFSALMDALKERAEIFGNRKELVVYKCSSWCKFPLNETDFGWGMPVWNTSINKLVSNTISLQDTTDGAVEVLITLDEEEMSIFEQHEELLEFASTMTPQAQTHAFHMPPTCQGKVECEVLFCNELNPTEKVPACFK